METIRKNTLRIHGALLTMMGIVMSTYFTLSLYETGTYNFLQADKLEHVELTAAYLLAVLTGIVLWAGSYQKNKKKWNRTGAFFHFFMLIIYCIHWNFFKALTDNEATKNAIVTFHLFFLVFETFCGFFSKKMFIAAE